MKRILIDIRAVATVPDDADVNLLAMTLQDSRALLNAYLDQSDFDVIVHTAPTRSIEERAPTGSEDGGQDG